MYNFFLGMNQDQNHWHLSRTLSDGGCMEGTAVFTPLTDKHEQLHYSEKGIFHQCSHPLLPPTEFYQDYVYTFYEKNMFSIHFSHEEGQKFMTFSTTQNPSLSTHVCKNDRYTGYFEQLTNDRFSLTYDVKGPRKNYRSVTHYLRAQTNL
ncbi:MAG: hypothetical protein K2X98_00910 [Alphaproteobacteria bacterium]|nr:hypothetical protein [Alphaproteobacteria bacterium]